jgi:hypothetical protein
MINPMYQTFHIDSGKPLDPQWARIGREFGFGPSPGGAAAFLGISRQAVAQAINKGALRACKVYEGSHHTATLVDAASLDAYKELRDLNGGRIPYRAKAI